MKPMTEEVNIVLSGKTEVVTAILKLLSTPVQIIQEITQPSKPDDTHIIC